VSVLLIHPPAAKACEPPAGIARLAGALTAAGIPCRLFDANLEGQLALLGQVQEAKGTWDRRALNGRSNHLAALRAPATYLNAGRYRRAVSDLNRLLAMAGTAWDAVPGLADYQQAGLSPLRSTDLLAAAEQPHRNPYFPWFSHRLPELLDGVDLVGISLNYLSQALCSFAMIGWLRCQAPQVRILLGGGLVTSWLQRPGWSNPFGGWVDRLVAGPGEAALLACCDAVPPAPAAAPDYTGLPLGDYLAPGLILPYSSASGCWWNACTFCPEQAEGNPYRPLPVARVLDELQSLTAATRPALLHLLDNALSPALLRGLADRPPGVPWYGFARVDDQLADPEFCSGLRRSGCVLLKLGLESGDQGVLDRLNKGIDLDIVKRALSSLQRAGIAVYGYLLFGTPAEDETAALRTLDFVAGHAGGISFLNVALFNLPLFAEEAAALATSPFYPGDLSLYTGFRHPRGWERGKVRQFLTRVFNRHPAVAPILRRDPLLFTSNHAAFFTEAYQRLCNFGTSSQQ